jgi:hypothetical protein
MEIKPWPENNATANFSDIALPICKAIRFCFDLERKNIDKDVPYVGLDIIEGAHVCLTADKLFTAAHLQYAEEDQGYDALEIIIGHAILLGIEQGKRIAMSNDVYKTLVLQAELGELLLQESKAKSTSEPVTMPEDYLILKGE